MKLDVLRDRNSLYRENSAGQIENIYTLKLMNKQNQDHEFLIEVSGVPSLQLEMDDPDTFVLAGEIKDVIVRLIVDQNHLEAKSTDIKFKITAIDNDDISAVQHARFLGPDKK